MSYDEHLISMAGGDGDKLDRIQRRAKDGDPSDHSHANAMQDRDYLLALVREQAAKLDAANEARMRVEKARHEIRIQRGTGEWNLGNIEHILKHDDGSAYARHVPSAEQDDLGYCGRYRCGLWANHEGACDEDEAEEQRTAKRKLIEGKAA